MPRLNRPRRLNSWSVRGVKLVQYGPVEKKRLPRTLGTGGNLTVAPTLTNLELGLLYGN